MYKEEGSEFDNLKLCFVLLVERAANILHSSGPDLQCRTRSLLL